MTITTGSSYSQLNISDSQSRAKVVNLQRFETKSTFLNKKKEDNDNKCDIICDDFLQCLEKTAYFYKNELECFNLAMQFKRCINNKD
jgi:hypothetical protein